MAYGSVFFTGIQSTVFTKVRLVNVLMYIQASKLCHQVQVCVTGDVILTFILTVKYHCLDIAVTKLS